MNLHISKSRNAESFYICKSYVKANGSTSSMIIRKLGTLEQLLVEHGPTRDDVLAWAKNEVKIETEKYKKEKEEKTVLIPFHADRHLDYNKQAFFRGGYLFLQSVYYQMQMNKTCRKLKQKYKMKAPRGKPSSVCSASEPLVLRPLRHLPHIPASLACERGIPIFFLSSLYIISVKLICPSISVPLYIFLYSFP